MFSRCVALVLGVGRRPLAAVVVSAVFVAVALAGSQGARTAVEATSGAAGEIVLQYRLPDLVHTTVDVNGRPYALVELAGEPRLLHAGAPDLPHVTRSVIIPDDGVMDVRVVDFTYEDLPDVDIVPSKGNLARTVDPDTVPYEFGVAYGTDAFYPGSLAEVREPYILRECRGAVVDVYPVQYNPVTRTLRLYTSLTVEVARVADGGANVLRRDTSRPSKVFDELYATHFVNSGPTLRYNPLDEIGDMLIICHDAWLPNIQPLVNHKNSIGIPTTAVGVATIGNNATAIKNYIQSVYNQGNLAFVLLVGDAAQVATPTASGGSADPTYSKLAGSDNYPDILVGRFSAETAAQVDTQVQRTITYEMLPATQQAWFKKGTGIASSQGAGQGDEGQADYVHIGQIRTWLLNYGYTQVDEIYDTNGGTAAMVTAALNNGRGIINYTGHGSTTSWGTTGFSNSNVAALLNDNMLPFIISVACVNGQFDGYTCFAEAWLRSTHNGQPIGAIGAYMSSINQSWAPPMEAQDEFNMLLTQVEANSYFSYGGLCFAGSCSMIDAYGSGGADMFNTWHIFGDPSLRIVGVPTPPHGIAVTPDTGLAAEGPAGGPFAPDSASYMLANLGDTALTYEVSASESWITIANGSGTLPPGGAVTVTVSLNEAANLLSVGLYAATIDFVNTTDHDGDTTRSVTLKVGVPTVQYAWNLDSSPGWSVQGQWQFGTPLGQGGVQHPYPDPSAGATGTNVYGVNLAGDYATTAGGPYYLTLGPVDLTGGSEVSLRFQRWLNSDYQPYVYATIEVSNDGANWTQVWSNGTTETKQNTWTAKQYDISAVATNQPNVWIRWGYKVGNGAYAYSGWNIDDVEIWALKASAPEPRPGDLNCDGIVTFADINPFVLALTDAAGYAAQFPGCNRLNADVSGNGTVGFEDINLFVNMLTTP